MENKIVKSNLRQRADRIKKFRCKNLITVIENPNSIKNVGTVIRNVNALGVDKVYVIDKSYSLPDDWQDMRQRRSLFTRSASAIKWSFVKVFRDTESCIEHLAKNGFVSVVTSPHLKGRNNVVLETGDFTKYKKLAVWFGNEGKGISDLALDNSQMCINIPMYGIIESLNLGTTTGIVLYEITKQRRAFEQEKKKKLHR